MRELPRKDVTQIMWLKSYTSRNSTNFHRWSVWATMHRRAWYQSMSYHGWKILWGKTRRAVHLCASHNNFQSFFFLTKKKRIKYSEMARFADKTCCAWTGCDAAQVEPRQITEAPLACIVCKKSSSSEPYCLDYWRRDKPYCLIIGDATSTLLVQRWHATFSLATLTWNLQFDNAAD